MTSPTNDQAALGPGKTVPAAPKPVLRTGFGRVSYPSTFTAILPPYAASCPQLHSPDLPPAHSPGGDVADDLNLVVAVQIPEIGRHGADHNHDQLDRDRELGPPGDFRLPDETWRASGRAREAPQRPARLRGASERERARERERERDGLQSRESPLAGGLAVPGAGEKTRSGGGAASLE